MIFLMDMAPPIHGMSMVNDKVYRFINRRSGKDFDNTLINTVPSYASKMFGTRFFVFLKLIHTFFCFFRLFYALLRYRRGVVVYRPLNGGYGLLFDVLYCFLIRFFGARVVFHHHSFNYINHRRLLFGVVHKLTEHFAIHVALGEEMTTGLMEKYGVRKDRVLILSNAAFFDISRGATKDLDINCLSVCYLSNVSVDKGVVEFVEIFRKLSTEKNKNYVGRIAGPFFDEKSKKVVLGACEDLPNLSYVGALYGDEKTSFLKDCDVFIFPSRYKNEAEPLVLYEAAMQGAFILGSRQGCMQSVIRRLGGQSFELDDIVNSISHFLCEMPLGEFSGSKRNERIVAYDKMISDSSKDLERLENFISGGGFAIPE